MQGFPLWWINWTVHLRILLVLLLCTFRYDRVHANLILLRVHGLHLLWFLSHARVCWFPCSPILCPSHISIDQMRVKLLSGGLLHLTDCFPDLVKATIRYQIGACRRIHFLKRSLYYHTMTNFFHI